MSEGRMVIFIVLIIYTVVCRWMANELADQTPRGLKR